jgi:hypothetical protein
MSYDVNFDQARLDQLAKHFLTESTAKGRVLFRSYDEENRLDHAKWRIEDADYDAMKISGFKHQLMELLDVLMIYRTQHKQPSLSQGVLDICNSKLAIEWSQTSEFEVLWEQCSE